MRSNNTLETWNQKFIRRSSSWWKGRNKTLSKSYSTQPSITRRNSTSTIRNSFGLKKSTKRWTSSSLKMLTNSHFLRSWKCQSRRGWDTFLQAKFSNSKTRIRRMLTWSSLMMKSRLSTIASIPKRPWTVGFSHQNREGETLNLYTRHPPDKLGPGMGTRSLLTTSSPTKRKKYLCTRSKNPDLRMRAERLKTTWTQTLRRRQLRGKTVLAGSPPTWEVWSLHEEAHPGKGLILFRVPVSCLL